MNIDDLPEREDIPPEIGDRERALMKPILRVFRNLHLMAGRYRDQDCVFLCISNDLDSEHIAVKPIAVVITEKDYPDCTDFQGRKPGQHIHKLKIEN